MLSPSGTPAFVLSTIGWLTGLTNTQFRILQGNDDGWAEANIRALHQLLTQAEYESIISAPTEDKSGTGSSSTNWTPLTRPGEYDSIPIGAPGVGSDASNDHIWYVNAYPVDGIRYGLDTLAPRFYAAWPDIVITGPNVGKNVGFMDHFSGTFGAANYAAKQGIPAIAVSADEDDRHSYQELTPNDASYIYAHATIRLLRELIKPGTTGPYLPPNCFLNVNLQKAGSGTRCKSQSDYKFALTTIHGFKHKSGLSHCGSEFLPGEGEIVKRQDGCWGSVTVIHSRFQTDGDTQEKAYVLNRSPEFFSCPS